MDANTIRHFIAARVAKEFEDGNLVNLGIGLPTLVSNYIPENVRVILHAENGTIGVGPKPELTEAHPKYLVDAGGNSTSILPGGAFLDSSASFSVIRGGHIDATVLGALEVDEQGNLANWIVPGKRISGMGGAMDLVVGAKKVIIAMEHTAKGAPKILKSCRLPLTAVRCVNTIITEMGVMRITDAGMALDEYNPEYTLEQIQAATECRLIISDKLKPMQ